MLRPLAVQLLNDAWLDRFDCAVVVSNDGDLKEALRIVNEDLHKKIGLVTPWRRRPLYTLQQYCFFVAYARKGLLASCQLPTPIPGTTICKPASWQ